MAEKVGRKNLKEQAKEPAPAENIEETVNVLEAAANDAAEAADDINNEAVGATEVTGSEITGTETEYDNASEMEEVSAGERKVLKALTHILYNSRLYSPDEELPTYDSEMVKAWLEAKTAVWDEGE